ncbi:O-antigen ligase family protein [Hyphococcus lacteus]|uniref:O-antigen ligase family protein n=1 Tax=Hyphococcus lacteus TaxID=3143536 RepID=A0ABV3Z597_9PROT
MSTHYKAFIVVFVLSVIGFVFFRKPYAAAIGAKRFDNWRNLWLAITACLFLIPSFWPYVIISALVVLFMSRPDPLKSALFMLLLFVSPNIGDAIPGFAGINKFIMVTPQAVFTFVLLIPAMIAAPKMKKLTPVGSAADVCFLLFLALQLILCLRGPTVTHIIRTMIEQFLVIAPFYFVFSRAPKSLSDIRIISAAYTMPILILSVLSILELIRTWHFYTSVGYNWFGAMPFTYTMRDGFLRASASVIDPIVWGFIAMTGIGVGLAFFTENFSKFYKSLGFGLLTIGLLMSLSRGPWMGAVAMILAFVAISPKAMTRAVQLGAASVLGGLIAMVTPFGQKILNLLPFVGTTAGDTISYRQQLLKAAREVMAENPFFGSSNYLDHPKLEALRQGQGIIDIVNSYLEVGLKSGFVGIALFVGVFLFALMSLRGAMKSAITYNPTLALYCRAYFATIVGIMITIFTTSSVYHTPIVYWSILGLAIALARIERHCRLHQGSPNINAQPLAPEAEATPEFNWK